MRVTIIADASFCQRSKAAGYAFWIACERGKEGGSGAVKTPVANNVVAEMIALTNALYHAARIGLVKTGDVVLLQTDCIPALQAFEGKRKVWPEEKEVVDYFHSLRLSLMISVHFRHVKGHTSGPQASEPRYYINNRCDVLAREAMRRMRHQLDKENS